MPGIDPEILEPLTVSISACIGLASAILMLCAAVVLFTVRMHRIIREGLQRTHQRLDKLENGRTD